MEKLLFLIISLLLSFNSYAQTNWSYMTTNQDGDDYYIEKNSIQNQGNSVTFWYRSNYKERTKFGDLSSKVQKTFNCRTQEHITRFAIFYDDLNNDGRVTTKSQPSNSSWAPIIPDTVTWSFYQSLCK